MVAQIRADLSMFSYLPTVLKAILNVYIYAQAHRPQSVPWLPVVPIRSHHSIEVYVKAAIRRTPRLCASVALLATIAPCQYITYDVLLPLAAAASAKTLKWVSLNPPDISQRPGKRVKHADNTVTERNGARPFVVHFQSNAVRLVDERACRESVIRLTRKFNKMYLFTGTRHKLHAFWACYFCDMI